MRPTGTSTFGSSTRAAVDSLIHYLIFKVLINAFIGVSVIEDFDGSRDLSSASTIDLIRLSHTKSPVIYFTII